MATNSIKNNHVNEIITPISVPQLFSLLEGFDPMQKKYIIHGFTNGFSIKSSGLEPPPFNKNHASAVIHANILEKMIEQEISSQRIAGPFDNPPLDPLVISPLGVIPKKETGKYRIIHDLSYPKQAAVNDSIDPSDASVSYETLDTVINHLLAIGKGALIAKVDIQEAFRIIPIAPGDRYLLGFKFNNQFYFDKCLPMGCRTSCAIFESFSKALQWIAIHKLNITHISHILDDFIIMGPPNSDMTSLQLNAFLQMCSSCNIPIKHSKTVLPSTCVTVHGIEVDTIAMQARLPRDKLQKARDMLAKYAKHRKITLTELQSLIGHLNFACRVVSPGRAFLRRLCNLTVGISNPRHHISLNTEARADIAAWLHFLSSFNGISMFHQNTWLHSDHLKFFSDASGTLGFAAVFGSHWFAHAWPPVFQDRHITPKELFPIVIALELWGPYLCHKKVLFKTDNSAVAAIINRQTCKDAFTMALVRRLVITSMRFNILFKAEYIPGFTNVIPDKLSRFLFQEARNWAPWLDQNPTIIPHSLLSAT